MVTARNVVATSSHFSVSVASQILYRLEELVSVRRAILIEKQNFINSRKISVKRKRLQLTSKNTFNIEDSRMMKPILFYDDRSPPARSCLLLIKILGIDAELKFVDLFKGEHLMEEFLQLNPLHTVPTLKDDNLVLTDSHPILMYLCDKYGSENKNWNLFPRDNIDENLRIKIINKLFFECGIVFRRDSDLMSEIFRETGKDIERLKEKVKESFTMINTFLKETKYVACDQLTIADISVVTTVSTVNLVIPIDDDRWPFLKKWFENLKSTLPFYTEVNETGLKKLAESLQIN